MIKTNYHTHTYRCKHAGGTEEDYVNKALELGLSILGFSDHAPFKDRVFDLRMDYSELSSYLNEIALLKEKHSADIILMQALEIEYLPDCLSYYEELLTKEKLDYLILGEHFYRQGQDLRNTYEATDTGCYIDYATQIAEGLDTGFFPILAHPDLIFINQLALDDNCRKAMDIILNSAAKNGTILEFNSNGIRRGKKPFPEGMRYPYPVDPFWQLVKEADLPCIVSSDCHSPEALWDESMDLAYRYVNELGIKPLSDPFGRLR